MKIVNDKNQVKAILNNCDVLVITAVGGNCTQLIVKCVGNTLHIEENMEVMNDKLEEEKAIKAIDKFLKKRQKEREDRIEVQSKKSS